MSFHAYTEDYLVEQPAIHLLEKLGWSTMSAMDEVLGPADSLRRETKSEVVLGLLLRAALERLNPTLPPEAITFAIDELARDRSAMSLAVANREIWELLRNGVKVLVPDRERRERKSTARQR